MALATRPGSAAGSGGRPFSMGKGKMSHVVTVDPGCFVRDVEALDRTCTARGWKLVKKSTYRWVGKWYDDSPVPRQLFDNQAEYDRVVSMDRAERCAYMEKFLGRCDWAIEIPGLDYEIGLVRVGDELVPTWDWADCRMQEAVGGQHTTDGTVRWNLAQDYSNECIRGKLREKGLQWTETVNRDGARIFETW